MQLWAVSDQDGDADPMFFLYSTEKRAEKRADELGGWTVTEVSVDTDEENWV